MNQPSSKPVESPPTLALLEDVMLDCDHILTHAGGDPDLLMQLCRAFLHELPVRLESLRAAIKLRDKTGSERALQLLRNCLILFGSGQVSSTAENLEAAVCANRARRVQQQWKRLEYQLKILSPRYSD